MAVAALSVLAFMSLIGIDADWPWWLVAIGLAVHDVCTSDAGRAFWRGLTG